MLAPYILITVLMFKLPLMATVVILREKYSKTKPSVRINCQQNLSKRPKYVVQNAIDELGGLLHLSNTTNIPRNENQLYNLIRHKNSDDILKQVIAMSQYDDSGILFVAEVPHLVIVLGHKWQLDLLEMVTNPSDSNLQNIIGIDITFNITEYFVTPLVFPHPMLMHSCGRKPYILGPVLISNSQKTDVFATFASALLISRPKLKLGKFVIGSDSQMAMFNGLKMICTNPKLILCIKHCIKHAEDNIKRKLDEMKCGHQKRKNILERRQLFDDSFSEGLNELKTMWEEKAPGFHKWFTTNLVSRFTDRKSVV